MNPAETISFSRTFKGEKGLNNNEPSCLSFLSLLEQKTGPKRQFEYE
jgi:hypothetical protein